MKNVVSVVGLKTLLLVWPLTLGAMECPSGTYQVRTHPRSSYYRADGTFVSAAQVHEHCREKNAIYDIWAVRLKNGFPPGWPQKKEVLAKWTEDQRERVLEALSEFPEGLLRMPPKGIYRLSKSVLYPNPASRADDVIVLYDSVFDRDHRLARILAHELAHQSYAHLNAADRNSYRGYVGWTNVEVKEDSIVWKERAGGYVEEDGRVGPDEDYANNLEYFLFQPDVLKVKTPKAFDWMTKHYGDKFKIGKGAK